MNKKHALVLGAGGAMAHYLIPKLTGEGWKVTGVCLDGDDPYGENCTVIYHDAKDEAFLDELLSVRYDAIIDFMIYTTVSEFAKYVKMLIGSTDHYVFLSTYRVYADVSPITEDSLRLADSELPKSFVRPLEYSIYKAEEEDYLRSSGFKNYTIIRPAITYSKRRFQLTTLEANVLLHRMAEGKTVLLPEGAAEKQGTMSWARDVADMIYAILDNRDRSLTETYTVSTSEHHTWREIAEIYRRIGGLSYAFIPDDDFLNEIIGGGIPALQQLKYDRCFDRVVDNSKILDLMGKSQSDLTTLEDGLLHEYSRVELSRIPKNNAIDAAMDKYIEKHGIK